MKYLSWIFWILMPLYSPQGKGGRGRRLKLPIRHLKLHIYYLPMLNVEFCRLVLGKRHFFCFGLLKHFFGYNDNIKILFSEL